MRARCDCLREGRLEPFSVDGQALSYFRTGEKDAIFCAVNRSDRPTPTYPPPGGHEGESLLAAPPGASGELFLPPFGCTILHTPPAEAAAHVKPVRMAAAHGHTPADRTPHSPHRVKNRKK